MSSLSTTYLCKKIFGTSKEKESLFAVFPHPSSSPSTHLLSQVPCGPGPFTSTVRVVGSEETFSLRRFSCHVHEGDRPTRPHARADRMPNSTSNVLFVPFHLCLGPFFPSIDPFLLLPLSSPSRHTPPFPFTSHNLLLSLLTSFLSSYSPSSFSPPCPFYPTLHSFLTQLNLSLGRHDRTYLNRLETLE